MRYLKTYKLFEEFSYDLRREEALKLLRSWKENI